MPGMQRRTLFESPRKHKRGESRILTLSNKLLTWPKNTTEMISLLPQLYGRSVQDHTLLCQVYKCHCHIHLQT